MSAKNKPNEIYLNRIFNAPVKTVWDAWTDPKQVGKWWGPRGYTITTHSMNVKTGGTWSYIMHGPNGEEHHNKTIFLEVEKYSRMVYDHGGNDDRPPVFRVTVNFSESAGKTKMEMTMALPTAEAATEIKKFIKKASGDSTWDRLAEYLSPNDRFFINRSFDAPLEKMFQVWTDPTHLSLWLPPSGFTMQFLRADIKVGGSTFYCMTGEPGTKMYGKATYKEIIKPNRIVYTQVFCDENEKITRHPAAPTWPETMLTTVTLCEEGPNRTRVTIEWEVAGEATAIERETFHKAKPGMTQGWTGSFDKLEDYLRNQK
ncbi:MAG: hypothetical protein COT73_07600 [Bdellovibrio sp. CG10_big_fil_rev_8_21_14_0_10_47_8]|nr:MAG: hypothetical protein COT73_07600 [Bdellovibrio sp. CG10_big_fil_rev_8_21_14_0_10_47_8]